MPFDLVAQVNAVLGTDYTKSSLLAACYSEQTRIKHQWMTSNRTDFSVYEDPGYLLDCILSYYCVSKRCLINGERYFRAKQVKKGRALDIYNGIGLSTAHANSVGFVCDALSSTPGQVELTAHFGKAINGKAPDIYTSVADIKPASYDVLFSFEVLEHFRDPVSHLNEVLPLLKPGGYLVESTGFRSADHIGHFETYLIDGKEVPGRQAATGVRKRLEQEMTKVMVGFDKKPRIWVKEKRPRGILFRGIQAEMTALGLSPFYEGQ